MCVCVCVCVCVCMYVCVCVCVCVCLCVNRKRNVFVADKTSDLHIREDHEYFPILDFEGSLSIEIAL